MPRPLSRGGKTLGVQWLVVWAPEPIWTAGRSEISPSLAGIRTSHRSVIRIVIVSNILSRKWSQRSEKWPERFTTLAGWKTLDLGRRSYDARAQNGNRKDFLSEGIHFFPSFLLFPLPDQHLHVVKDLYACTHIWHRTDCIWITVAVT